MTVASHAGQVGLTVPKHAGSSCNIRHCVGRVIDEASQTWPACWQMQHAVRTASWQQQKQSGLPQLSCGQPVGRAPPALETLGKNENASSTPAG